MKKFGYKCPICGDEVKEEQAVYLLKDGILYDENSVNNNGDYKKVIKYVGKKFRNFHLSIDGNLLIQLPSLHCKNTMCGCITPLTSKMSAHNGSTHQ